jgi:hypothetical protein
MQVRHEEFSAVQSAHQEVVDSDPSAKVIAAQEKRVRLAYVASLCSAI